MGVWARRARRTAVCARARYIAQKGCAHPEHVRLGPWATVLRPYTRCAHHRLSSTLQHSTATANRSPDRQSASLPTPTTDSRLDHRFSTTPQNIFKNSGPNGSNESTSKLSLVLGALVETAILLDYNEQDGRPVLITTSARTHGVLSPHYCTREFIGLWVTHSGILCGCRRHPRFKHLRRPPQCLCLLSGLPFRRTRSPTSNRRSFGVEHDW